MLHYTTPHHTTPHHTTPHHCFVSYILEWINHESTFIFWLFVLSVTSVGLNLLPSLPQSGYWGVFFHHLSMFLYRVSIIFLFAVTADLILYCLLKKLPFLFRAVKILLLAPSAVMFALDIFTLWNYKSTFDVTMLEIAMMTNLREGSEFLADFLFSRRFLAFAAGVVLMLAVLRKIYSFFQQRNIFLLLILIVGTLTGCLSILLECTRESVRTELLASSFTFSRIYSMFSELHDSQKAYENMLKESTKEILITSKGRGIPNTVFILGEATSRNHMQIYGYNLPDNPKLSARRNIHIFTDTVSSHANTIFSIRKMFTFYRYDSPGEWFMYTTLFRILKEAGCHTEWISNQESRTGGKPIALFSGQCDSSYFTENFSPQSDNYDKIHDGCLLTFLDEAMKSKHRENFYLIHLMGAHSQYKRRYPPEFEKFTADDEKGGLDGISRAQKQTRAEYDNAILYNDFIVDEIIRRFENENAIVIYASDHGEEVYDSMNFIGHYDENPSRYVAGNPSQCMIEIPMIIWTSDKFRQAYPELESRIASSVNKPYMTDDIIHTVLDIMGIETPGYDPSKSIVNPKFDSSRKRIYAGKQYDKESGLHEIQ